ncbi:MAG: GGDEF domain-containing protein [Firmicutes bacterium]|nr:GGDEF domain-containing protein [Bacillota bacterium]
MIIHNQTNIIAIVILLIIFFSFQKQVRSTYVKNRYFFGLVIFNVSILVVEIIHNTFEGISTNLGQFIYVSTIAIYFLLIPIIISTWILYINYHVYEDNTNRKKLLLFLSPLLIVNLLFIALSLFGLNFVFYIDQMGNYQRGEYYNTILILSYVVLILSLFYILWHKQVLSKTDLLALIMFPIPPMVASMIQFINPEFILLWPSMTVSIIIIYINIQSRIINTDPLTGLFNRREFDKQVNYLSNTKNLKKNICAIMIDIDDFKLINDEHSHQVGDLALVDLGLILKKSVRKEDFIARIGGDEFCVILEAENEGILFETVDKINENIKLYNQRKHSLKPMDLSMGYGVYNPKYYESFYEFFDKLDRKMYNEKNLGKQNKNAYV